MKRKEDAKLRNRSAIVKQQAEIGIQMMQEARREKFIRESEEQSRLKLRQEMNIKRKQQEFEQAKTILNSKRRER